ncbi:MAG: CRISPR-associated endonuclease Cas1 [Cyanobacteriota bacterium]|nr:CRISPR-associated endonuclease Cas1 [Cyanobacteriota bacterium]
MSEILLSHSTPNAEVSSISLVNQFLSLENFQRAWNKVAEKKGCEGIDGETIAKFSRRWKKNLAQLRDSVANSTYQPLPCKQVLIPKKKGDWRELRIPTVRDRIVQQALLNVLYPIAEPTFSSASFAYRPNLSYLNAVEEVARWRDLGYSWVLDADIEKFFDTIDHQRLLREVRKYLDSPGILCLIKAWISLGISTKNGQIQAEKGIPQGAVISPLLANIYLDEFDRLVPASDLKLVRYADDFVVLARTHERIIKAFSEVQQILQTLGLTLHPKKTQITHFDRGFRFLGHAFLDRAIFPAEPPKAPSASKHSGNKNRKKKGLADANADKINGKRVSTFSGSDSLEFEELEVEDFTSILCKNIWNKDMATLYLTEQGTTLHKEHQRLIVRMPEDRKLELPIREVERILVFGNIQLTTQVIGACLQEPTVVLFLSQSGQYRGHLWGLKPAHLDNEFVQFKKHRDPGFQLQVSQEIVRGKLLNSKQLLLRLNRKRRVAEVHRATSGIASDLAAIDSVDNLDTLRGYEGISAARYFPALGQLITNSDFQFSQRFRHPPTDPVNSLLSFGYTLLLNNVLSLIIAEGLCPYLGNFHYGEDKKPYLAFDLMEEFRSPVVDSLALKVINSSMFGSGDFEKIASKGGIYLKSPARRTFLQQFEKRMNEEVSHPERQSPVSYRQAIQLQVRRYKYSLLYEAAYEPFLRMV